MRHIVFKGQKYKQVSMNIYPDAPFNKILKEINSLTLPIDYQNDEHTRYAILELINNSIRAQKENSSKEPIKLEIKIENNIMTVVITDSGRGFDISDLPYDINEPVKQIDPNKKSFQDYREKNQYKRFGLGLLVARKQFHQFEITFYNNKNETVPSGSIEIKGTIIKMSLELSDG